MAFWGTLLEQGVQSTISLSAKKHKWQVLSAIAPLLLIVFMLLHHTSSSTIEVRNLIFSGLKNADQLTAVTIDAKATIRVEKPSEVFGVKIGQTNFVYEGVSQIQAGINLKQLQVKSVSPGKVHLVLPAPYIRDIGLNVGRSTILANYKEWIAPKATPELQEEAQLKAIAAIRQEACDSNILEAANTSAKQLLTEILTKLKYTTIEIETQLPTDRTCAE
ncbi:DUF4230 domain-containing protein [Leptolyngbya sp. NIES-2104]|uniref:DUF4230 domain-containing protein n=1 Tax=Leptolyngbya sp. NIES-2104 TaxID=1552121 RepID=UPI0006EC979F|nr:DUF4230 domain-containing protein [Leptolyngbya sp. NIES-2104]GAP97907.1 hypothetical protein NIES2104_44600 [Leptolyngbya sp. NIES-2104]